MGGSCWHRPAHPRPQLRASCSAPTSGASSSWKRPSMLTSSAATSILAMLWPTQLRGPAQQGRAAWRVLTIRNGAPHLGTDQHACVHAAWWLAGSARPGGQRDAVGHDGVRPRPMGAAADGNPPSLKGMKVMAFLLPAALALPGARVSVTHASWGVVSQRSGMKRSGWCQLWMVSAGSSSGGGVWGGWGWWAGGWVPVAGGGVVQCEDLGRSLDAGKKAGVTRQQRSTAGLTVMLTVGWTPCDRWPCTHCGWRTAECPPPCQRAPCRAPHASARPPPCCTGPAGKACGQG